MDLALALVELDWGHDIALQVARYNVMYMMRPGGQSQFSAHLVAQEAEDPAINAGLDYILKKPRRSFNRHWSCGSGGDIRTHRRTEIQG
ncbi:MAG: hypothetical protein ABJL99_14430 [Aliishimia sp.]